VNNTPTMLKKGNIKPSGPWSFFFPEFVDGTPHFLLGEVPLEVQSIINSHIIVRDPIQERTSRIVFMVKILMVMNNDCLTIYYSLTIELNN